MGRHRRWILAGLVLAAGALAGPVASASASSSSIKAAVVSYEGRILVAEGKVVSAVGTYKTDHVAEPVLSAIGNSVTVLSGLRAKVARQPAARTRVKKAKRLIVRGLTSIIASYEKLKTAFAEKGSDPEAAVAEANQAEAVVKAGRKQLLAGLKML